MQGRRISWTSDGISRGDGASNERRALEYHDAEAPYRDQPDVEDVEDNEGIPALRVVPSLLRDDDDERR
jgi:hypothetical protein